MPSAKPRVNHATVVAYLALFVALGGSAYAGAALTGRDIANGSLSGKDLRNSSVRSADVKGITGADLGAGAPWTLRSPNRQFSLEVGNDGVRMEGPAGEVAVGSGGVVEIRSSGPVAIDGPVINLNGSCAPVADATKVFQHTHVAPPGGGTTSVGSGPLPGFTTVRAG